MRRGFLEESLVRHRSMMTAVIALVLAACQPMPGEPSPSTEAGGPSSTVAQATDETSASTVATTTVAAPTDRYLTVEAIEVVTTDGGRMDWGPDGRIVYDTRTRGVLYDVWILDLESPDESVCVTCDAEGLPEGHRGNPDWHPSGDWIIFQAGVKVGNPLVTHPGSGVANEIWAIRPDGTDARELRDIADPDAFDGSLHPHFNHAGDEIVFARFIFPPDVFEVHTLPFEPLDPGSADPIALIPGDSPDWSEALYETHGYTADDSAIIFTGYTPSTEKNNDILIADAETGELIDQVTATPGDWDEHAHIQPGTDRLLFSSSRDIPNGLGDLFGLDSQADWWVREHDGVIHRLTYFADPEWPLHDATMTSDGSSVMIPNDKLFAADGEFSPDGSAYAGVLLFRTLRADEWIVILRLADAAAP